MGVSGGSASRKYVGCPLRSKQKRLSDVGVGSFASGYVVELSFRGSGGTKVNGVNTALTAGTVTLPVYVGVVAVDACAVVGERASVDVDVVEFSRRRRKGKLLADASGIGDDEVTRPTASRGNVSIEASSGEGDIVACWY